MRLNTSILFSLSIVLVLTAGCTLYEEPQHNLPEKAYVTKEGKWFFPCDIKTQKVKAIPEILGNLEEGEGLTVVQGSMVLCVPRGRLYTENTIEVNQLLPKIRKEITRP